MVRLWALTAHNSAHGHGHCHAHHDPDFFATEVTQGPLLSVHYTLYAHKHTPNSRCAIWRGFQDTIKMSSRSRGTCLGDLAGDLAQAAGCGHGTATAGLLSLDVQCLLVYQAAILIHYTLLLLPLLSSHSKCSHTKAKKTNHLDLGVSYRPVFDKVG